jgi:hypothetical protein
MGILLQILSLIFMDRPAAANLCGSYAHCVTLTMPSSGITGETNFVAPYTFSGSVYLKTVGNAGYVENTVAQTGGSGLTVPADGIFTSDSSCATPVAGWEWGAYNGTTGNGSVYINFGTASNNKQVRFCVGKVSVTTWQGDVPGTWPGYASVNHWGNGTTLNYHDSTSNDYVSVPDGTPTAGAGIVAGGIVTSSGNVVDSPTVTSLSGSMTTSTWVKTSYTADYQRPFDVENGGNTYTIQIGDSGVGGVAQYYNGYPAASPSGVAGAADIRDGNWHHVVAVFDSVATTLKLYVDGSLVDTSAAGASNPSPFTTFRIGSFQTNNNLYVFVGTSSELCRSGSVRSAARIAMEYAAFSAPTSWLTLAVIQ